MNIIGSSKTWDKPTHLCLPRPMYDYVTIPKPWPNFMALFTVSNESAIMEAVFITD